MNHWHLKHAIYNNVCQALSEDIGSGDVSAALIDAKQYFSAHVITREKAMICGRPWFDEVMRQVDDKIKISWHVDEGQTVEANTLLVELTGPSKSLLTAERTALNFLQLLSGIATKCAHYVDIVKETSVQLLDTRKTIPGLRLAQKYAVKIGGCMNHRFGLYDAFLIKENHIMSCGSIVDAVKKARQQNPTLKIEVEVETLKQLHEALNIRADIIMLDNFPLSRIKEAVLKTQTITSSLRPKLEASGNISKNNLLAIALAGVDYISIGSLTKHCQAIDLSMRFKITNL